MEKKILDENFILYAFSERECRALPRNIYALLDGGRALLIDAGYPEQASVVRQDLASAGVDVEKIIVSHYHGDHVCGITEFSRAEVIGSRHYLAGFAGGIIESGEEALVPRTVIGEKALEMRFGSFTLRILPRPGHSVCELHILVDSCFIHVGDTVIDAENGRPALPLVFHDCEEYIRTLEDLRRYSSRTLLLGHGKPIRDESAFLAAVEGRIRYLRNLLAAGAGAELVACLEGCDLDFVKTEFHDRNLMRLSERGASG
jgi:glyoxylase-like metal-dependent hydrolase (beta-lactamase superfamily II)